MHKSTWTALALAAGVMLTGGPAGRAEDDAVAKQKAVAQENAQTLGQLKPLALFEQGDLLVVGDLPEGQLQRLAQGLQKQYVVAARSLGFGGAAKPWPGKLAVYVLSDKGTYASFVRSVEKRSPESGESATTDVRRPEPHVAVGPPGRGESSVEQQAGRQVAAALLTKRAMPNAVLPEWLREGFGRATAYRSTFGPSQLPARSANREWSAKVPRRASVVVVWDESLAAELRPIFGANLADLLAYGPFMDRFPAFVQAFRPMSDEKPNPTTIKEALEAAKIDLIALEKAWSRWR
jgi:hypothetical protein